MLRWLEGLLWRPDRRKKDDDDMLLPLYGVREGEEEEQEEEQQEKHDKEQDESEFVQEIFKSAGGGRAGGAELNFYFDMFSTIEEEEVQNAEPVRIWWMSRKHPYARQLMALRAVIWKRERKLIFTPYRVRSTIYGFSGDIVEKAIEDCINLCSKHNLIKIQEDVMEQQQQTHEEAPVISSEKNSEQ